MGGGDSFYVGWSGSGLLDGDIWRKRWKKSGCETCEYLGESIHAKGGASAKVLRQENVRHV